MFRTFFVLVVVLSIICANSGLSQQNRIMIGTELGPEYILHGGFIDESAHQVFMTIRIGKAYGGEEFFDLLL